MDMGLVLVLVQLGIVHVSVTCDVDYCVASIANVGLLMFD